jgi:hypothetical protein
MVVKELDYIQYLLNMKNLLYMTIDIAKILIKYDILNTHKFEKDYYVVISDLDILLEGDEYNKQRGLICTENYMKDFSEQSIFDDITLDLLNNFGYIMAKDKNYPPENGFMIMKNDDDIIHGLKTIFIDRIFKNLYLLLFTNFQSFGFIDISDINDKELICKKIIKYYNLSAQFIFNCYNWFSGYINLIRGYQYITISINKKFFIKEIPEQFIELNRLPEDDILIEIRNPELFWFINDFYRDPFTLSNMIVANDEKLRLNPEINTNYFFNYINDKDIFSNGDIYLSQKGQHIYNPRITFIYPYKPIDIDSSTSYHIKPSKCVKLEKSQAE